MTSPVILSLRRLTRRFGTREVLRDLSLDVAPGERVALRGPNGSGKTTLLRCVVGTVTPTAGEIRVGPYLAGSSEARRLVGTALALERSFYLRLTGRSNLLFYARLRTGDLRRARRDVAAVEEELQLTDVASERVDRCSTGMIQQLGFARALLASPALLLLDEPTRSLDDDATERLWAALDRRPGAATVIATHRTEDVDRCTTTLDLHA